MEAQSAGPSCRALQGHRVLGPVSFAQGVRASSARTGMDALSSTLRPAPPVPGDRGLSAATRQPHGWPQPHPSLASPAVFQQHGATPARSRRSHSAAESLGVRSSGPSAEQPWPDQSWAQHPLRGMSSAEEQQSLFLGASGSRPQHLVPQEVELRPCEVDEVWLRMRAEARKGGEAEPFLASYLSAAILAHPSLESALAFHLANKLASDTLLSTQLKALFTDVLCSDPAIKEAVRADLLAVEARDPACQGLVHGMLNFKGFQACQSHRIAHCLWRWGRHGLALALANRVSETFHVEIHPAVQIGKGIFLDHATGIIIGETVQIGDNVSILHHVTLGGTGNMGQQRHPHVEEGVLIGTGAKLLGPITVGAGAKVGAGSVVLESVPPGATVVGNPGRVRQERQKPHGAPPSLSPGETMEHAVWDDYVI